MLPLILGGMAVVATSCAIKEYYEEEKKLKPKSILDTCLEKRRYLSEREIPRALVLVRAVNESYTLKRVKPLVYPTLPIEMLSENVKNQLQIYNNLLEEAEHICSQYMVGLEVILNKNVSYAKYDKEEVFFIKKAQVFIKKLDKYLNIKLYDKSGELHTQSNMHMLKWISMMEKHHAYTKIIDELSPHIDWTAENGFQHAIKGVVGLGK